jgi:hypothetical protein
MTTSKCSYIAIALSNDAWSEENLRVSLNVLSGLIVAKDYLASMLHERKVNSIGSLSAAIDESVELPHEIFERVSRKSFR